MKKPYFIIYEIYEKLLITNNMQKYQNRLKMDIYYSNLILDETQNFNFMYFNIINIINIIVL